MGRCVDFFFEIFFFSFGEMDFEARKKKTNLFSVSLATRSLRNGAEGSGTVFGRRRGAEEEDHGRGGREGEGVG